VRFNSTVRALLDKGPVHLHGLGVMAKRAGELILAGWLGGRHQGNASLVKTEAHWGLTLATVKCYCASGSHTFLNANFLSSN